MPKKTYGRAGTGVRRMARPWVLTGLALCVLLIAAGIWLYGSGKVWSLGPVGAAVVIAAVIVGSNLLEGISTRTDKMERGWVAEDQVESVLATLGDDCYVIHDVSIGERGNIDHVVVTPTGVYTIETKSHAGKVTFDGQRLLLNGRPLEKDFLAQAYAESMVLKDYLAKISGGEDYYVTPLIVFTRGFVQIKGRAKGVKVLPLKWLTGELTRGKPRLSDAQGSAIARSLMHLTAEARSSE